MRGMREATWGIGVTSRGIREATQGIRKATWGTREVTWGIREAILVVLEATWSINIRRNITCALFNHHFVIFLLGHV